MKNVSATHSAVKQVHLVNEQVAEHSRARNDNVHARPAKLLQRDELELVHAADRVRDGPYAGEAQHLGERFT